MISDLKRNLYKTAIYNGKFVGLSSWERVKNQYFWHIRTVGCKKERIVKESELSNFCL